MIVTSSDIYNWRSGLALVINLHGTEQVQNWLRSLIGHPKKHFNQANKNIAQCYCSDCKCRPFQATLHIEPSPCVYREIWGLSLSISLDLCHYASLCMSLIEKMKFVTNKSCSRAAKSSAVKDESPSNCRSYLQSTAVPFPPPPTSTPPFIFFLWNCITQC